MLLVTGGSRGIGAATARLAARRGYAVAIMYRERAADAQRVVEDCRAQGVPALALAGEVSDESDVLAVFDAVEQRLGPLSALVNNAGIVAPQARVADLDAARIDRMLRVNVLGAFLCAREAVRRMSRSAGGRGGAIVNVSSRAAVLGSAGEYVDYAASKAAMDTLTIGLAREVAADGIRVNAVRPGLIDTDIHASGGRPDRVELMAPTIPMGRGGQSDEVAAAILWLLSAEASYATGTFLDVSGGR